MIDKLTKQGTLCYWNKSGGYSELVVSYEGNSEKSQNFTGIVRKSNCVAFKIGDKKDFFSRCSFDAEEGKLHLN